MTLVWLTAVALPSTALAWNLLRLPPDTAGPASAPAPLSLSLVGDDFAADGKVYQAVERSLRDGGLLV